MRTLLLPPPAFAAGTSLAGTGFVASLVGGSLLAVAMSLLAGLLPVRRLPGGYLSPSFSLRSSFGLPISFSLPPAHASGFPSGPTFFRLVFGCPRDPCAVAPTRGAWSRFLPRALPVAPAA